MFFLNNEGFVGGEYFTEGGILDGIVCNGILLVQA